MPSMPDRAGAGRQVRRALALHEGRHDLPLAGQLPARGPVTRAPAPPGVPRRALRPDGPRGWASGDPSPRAWVTEGSAPWASPHARRTGRCARAARASSSASSSRPRADSASARDPSRNVAMAGRRGCRRATGAFHGRTRKTVLLVHTAASGAWLGIDVVPGVVVLAVFTPGPAGARSGIGRDRHVHRVAARGGSGGADDGRRAEPWVEVRADPLLVGGGEAGPQRGHRRDLGG